MIVNDKITCMVVSVKYSNPNIYMLHFSEKGTHSRSNARSPRPSDTEKSGARVNAGFLLGRPVNQLQKYTRVTIAPALAVAGSDNGMRLRLPTALRRSFGNKLTRVVSGARSAERVHLLSGSCVWRLRIARRMPQSLALNLRRFCRRALVCSQLGVAARHFVGRC